MGFKIFFMRKNVFGKRLKRDMNERKALIKGLLSHLVLEERIKTTEQKAKAIKGEADKLITKSRKESNLARTLLGDLLIPQATEKLLSELGPRFKDRNGGYTRIVRLGRRFGDDASMVVLEWVEQRVDLPKEAKKEKKAKLKTKVAPKAKKETKKQVTKKTAVKKVATKKEKKK